MQTIDKIIEIRDTRQYEEGPDDKFHPIPGSGIENNCYRCGRSHEVHATVVLSDGTTAVVGTSCMKEEAADVLSRCKSMTSAAKMLAKNRAQLATVVASLERWREAMAAANTLELPEITADDSRSWNGRTCYTMGDAKHWESFDYDGLTDRLREGLAEDWRIMRAADIAGINRYAPKRLAGERDDLLHRIEQLERKLQPE